MSQISTIIYKQFQPHQALSSYVDAFWTVTGENSASFSDKIMPDGCVDIILNLGAEFKTDNETVSMKSNQVYLVGTMTSYKNITRPSMTKLIGVRFKPGAFSCFYDYSFLHGIANKTVEFDKKLIPDINEGTKDLSIRLNHFLIDRLSKPKQPVFTIISDIYNLKGQVNVGDLAKRHFITIRQLERYFKLNMDISPKEFINFVRYQFVLEKIRTNHENKSLLHIAYENGYYDHSHLSNEIKKYTGLVPSEI